MKELLKEWRKFLKESQSKYFPWIDMLSGDDYDDVITSIRKSKQFKRLGSGGYREVFEHLSDSNHVIKLSKEESNFSNYAEKVVSDNFPSIFPKVYASHPYYLWIVSEKCDILLEEDDEKWKVGLQNSMPRLLDYIKNEIFPKFESEKGVNYSYLSHYKLFILILASIASKTKSEIFYDPISSLKIPKETYNEMIDYIFNFGIYYEGWFLDLSKAIQRFGVDANDLSEGNIGQSFEDGTLKIIDSSIFEKKMGEYSS